MKEKIVVYIKKEYVQVCLLMLIVELFYLFDILKMLPLHTTSDELGAMIAPAYLAGRNWSGVVSHSGYYGFGFFVFFFWIFKITSDPIIIFRIMLIVCSIERILQIPIAYYIGKKYLSISKGFICASVAVLMPFLHTNRIVNISNEYSIELIVWLDILLVLKIVEYASEREQGRIYVFLWVILLTYSQTIHTRLQVLVIANIIVVILISIGSKKRRILIGSNVILLILISGIKEVVKIYQENVWGSSENLRNASVEVVSNFNILSGKTWSVWGHMILGMFDTMILVFGGLFLFAVVTFIFYLVNRIIQLKKEKLEMTYIDSVLLITILCIGATVLAFLVSSWGDGILRGWDSRGTSNDYFYSFKGLTYIRYWEPYVAPFCLATLALIVNTMVPVKKIIATTLFSYVIFQSLFINLVMPLIEKNVNSLGPLRGISMFKINEAVTKNNYLVAILIATSVFLIGTIFVLVKKYSISWIIFVAMLVFQYKYAIYQYDFPIQERMSSMIDASYNKIRELEEQDFEFDNIYIYDIRENVDNNWKMYSVAQFYLNKYTLIEGKRDVLTGNDIIISCEKLTGIEGLYGYQLDKNEVWYSTTKISGLESIQIN